MNEITIPLRSQDEAILVLGPYDRHAKLLRQVLDIEVYTQGGNLRLRGEQGAVEEAQRRVEHLLGKLRKGRALEVGEIEGILAGPREGEGARGDAKKGIGIVPDGAPILPPGERMWRARSGEPARGEAQRIVLRTKPVEPRGANQARYLEAIGENSLTFGTGVSGTGKTYLAVAAAVRRLRGNEVKRLVITRPVVEAGEHLGFLPGDLQAKLNPYMRPVYDALYDLIGFEDTNRLEEAGVIEVAPLAFMRGRTLSQAFVILDEAQNTSVAQMKMFLTRLGEGSCMVVSGDPTQTDLDDPARSGLVDAVRRLRGYTGVAVVEFGIKDIVRHPLVEQIVRAYELAARSLAQAMSPRRRPAAEVHRAEVHWPRAHWPQVHWTVPGPRLLSEAEVRAVVAAALGHGGQPDLAVSVVFVSDAELARLHGEHLGDPRPTDVMAFELGKGGGGAAAEVYVSVERARVEARARDLAPEAELALYVVHGCLHLCGHDDRRPRLRARMRAAERAVLARLGYA